MPIQGSGDLGTPIPSSWNAKQLAAQLGLNTHSYGAETFYWASIMHLTPHSICLFSEHLI